MTPRDSHQLRYQAGETLLRFGAIERLALNEDTRTLTASLSSDYPVERWGEVEILSHANDAVDLSRVTANGLPLLWSHNPTAPVGRARNLRLERGRLVADLTFGTSARAAEVWDDVRDGIVDGVSIGYVVKEYTNEKGSNRYTATRWELLEASIVSVPADPTVGINRAQETRPMSDTTTPAAAAETPAAPVVAHFEAVRKLGEAEGRKAALAEQAERAAAIMAAAAAFASDPAVAALRDASIADAMCTADAFRARLLDMISQRAVPAGGKDPGAINAGHRDARVSMGESDAEKFREAALHGLLLRGGRIRDAAERRRVAGEGFGNLSLVDMARECLQMAGVSCQRMAPKDVVSRALSMRSSMVGHNTGDFPGLLIDAFNKVLLVGYDETPETWRTWCRIGSTNDFKVFHRAALGAAANLLAVPENGEYQFGSMSDVREQGQLVTSGRLFSVTRQAIINDDLGAMLEVPQKMGRAAARRVGDQAYGVLTGNPVLLQDGIALFNAAHSNVGSVNPPSVITLDAARVAMARQTAPGNVSAVLNIRPRYLIVPVTLETAARILATSEFDPAGTTTTTARRDSPNPFRGTLEVIADPRLDVASTAAYYLAADPATADTVEVVFLNGQETPYLEEHMPFSVDGVAFKVRLDSVAIARDFRGLQRAGI